MKWLSRLLTSLAPLLACMGLLCIWQAASLMLDTGSFRPRWTRCARSQIFLAIVGL